MFNLKQILPVFSYADLLIIYLTNILFCIIIAVIQEQQRIKNVKSKHIKRSLCNCQD